MLEVNRNSRRCHHPFQLVGEYREHISSSTTLSRPRLCELHSADGTLQLQNFTTEVYSPSCSPTPSLTEGMRRSVHNRRPANTGHDSQRHHHRRDLEFENTTVKYDCKKICNQSENESETQHIHTYMHPLSSCKIQLHDWLGLFLPREHSVNPAPQAGLSFSPTTLASITLSRSVLCVCYVHL